MSLAATLHDGATVEFEVHGEGPSLLLPVNPRPVEGEQAEQMRKYGADPALGRTLIEGLREDFRVVAFDYEGHVLGTPKPDTLTPSNVAADLLAVADAAGVARFAYYGYSWLALVGFQLALRTDRMSALVMGGFPPLDAPYAEMMRVTRAAYEMARTSPGGAQWQASDDEWVGLSEAQTKQFVTLYEELQGFDDRAAQAAVTCPRLCFVGAADAIEYGPDWGDVEVNLADPIVAARDELEDLGWDVVVLEGLDHMEAMQASRVLPVLRPWLVSRLSTTY